MYKSSIYIIIGLASLASSNELSGSDVDEELVPHGRYIRQVQTEVSRCPFRAIHTRSLVDWISENDLIFQTNVAKRSSDEDDSTQTHLLKIRPLSSDNIIDCQSIPNTTPRCNSSYPYRTFDGSCNNLNHPTWGVAGECQLRFLPASYEGLDGLRRSVSGHPLPRPRDLSLRILSDLDRPTPRVSFMFTIFGQVIAHDQVFTPSALPLVKPCCPFAANQKRPECIAIQIRADDPFYSQFNVTCLDLARSTVCSICGVGKVQHTNAITAAIDLNIVYSISEVQARGLRTNDGTGKLRSNNDGRGENLPKGTRKDSYFCPDNSTICSVSGDQRVDQHAALTSMQTILMREHNRIATILKEMHPHWRDERLFQESRKILIGKIQSIVYQEYLPSLLGRRHMSYFKLWVNKDNTGTRYNSSVRLGSLDEVGTAAYRLHSMVATRMGTADLRFRDTYSNPGLVRQGCAGQLLQGVCSVPSQKFDRWFVTDVTDYLYKRPNQRCGQDLGSSDIQRGRDNGMPPYVDMLKYVTDGQVDVRTFDDLSIMMNQDYIQLLRQNYYSVKDIDLFVGLQMENHVEGSTLGFTTVSLVAIQFYYKKYGDRYYFEHEGEAPSFTPDQREALKKSTLSRLLCDNTETTSVQRNALRLPSKRNPKVECDQLPKVDMEAWRHTPN